MKYGNILKCILDKFLKVRYPKIQILSRYASLLPCAKRTKFFKNSCAGNNFILVGDAAGHVDPIWGEGILYAIWSGKLAAEAIYQNNLELFDRFWKKEYGSYLMECSKNRENFYNPVRIEYYIMQNIYKKRP